MGWRLCSEGEDEVVREHDPLGRDVELFNRHLYIDGKRKPTSKGVVGIELVDGLVIQECDYKLVKTRFSALFNTNLHSYLQVIGVTNLVTVDSTAAATPDIHIGMYSQAPHQALQIPQSSLFCAYLPIEF
ncbi:putative inactive nicotinamidase [Capsicum chinense]|nr:putative inactive nicotinamidase [Capsicum chinense]